MKKKIASSIINHYSDLYKKFGLSAKSIGWLSGRQSIRFDAVSKLGKIHNSSILDVGCGFGDFYGFLKYKKINVNYWGVDINEDFIEIARKKYPKANFEVRDIQKEKFLKKFDWVFAIGTTNHASTYNHLKNLIEEMFYICRKGVVIDFISDYVDFKDKEIFYTNPEKIFRYCKSLTRRVSLRHDYMPYEFLIYLYKNDKKNKKNVFQEYYNSLPKGFRNDEWLK